MVEWEYFSVKDKYEEFMKMMETAEKCQRHNNICPSSIEERMKSVKEIFNSIGDTFVVMQPLYCTYGTNVDVGENFASGVNFTILDKAKVTIGDNVFIGPNTGIYTSGHPLDVERRNELIGCAAPVTIGNSVWLGGNVTVLPGVSIGDNSVIGAGSVVNRDIPPNTLAVGNPCRVIRELD